MKIVVKVETLIAKSIEERNNIVDKFYEKIAEEGWINFSFDMKTDNDTGYMIIQCTFLERKPEYINESSMHI